MTLELRKIHLIERILSIRDEVELEKYEDFARREKIKTYEASLKPMTQKEYENRILEAEEDVKAGKLISLEDLQKEMENW